jgi:hypothetical protein
VNRRAPLFDARARDDNGYIRFDETTYGFLDRVDDVFFARIRDLLNQWFTELDDDETAERLRRDFTSERDEQVDGAFWELYLHAALIRTPLEVELEPGRDRGRQPDFRAWPPTRPADEFLLEPRAVGDPPASRAEQRRLQQVWDSVNAAAPTGFMVHMRRVTRGKENPSGVRLRNEIVSWLQSLDRSALRAAVDAGNHVLRERRFEIDDWVFEVAAWPLAEGAEPRHLIGIGPVRTAWGGSRATLLSALKKKRSRYELGEKPFVLAIANLHAFAGSDDVVDALFGEKAVRILGEDADGQLVMEPIRRRNGFFGEVNTRVSALLHALRLVPWAVADVVPELWLNPWARTTFMLRFPWARTISVDHDGRLVVNEATVSPRDLFGLPPEWPGPEQPFERRSSIAPAGRMERLSH